MDNWIVPVSQNGWEYTGHVIITAKEVFAVGDREVLADGTLITFDEEIGAITKGKDAND